MRTDWNRARFKETGKTTFLANYWPFVGVLALLLLLSGNAVVYQLNQITNDLIELFWVAGIMEPVPFLQRVEVYTDWSRPSLWGPALSSPCWWPTPMKSACAASC